MKHLKFISIAFAILLFTGCSSDDSSDNINPNQSCKIFKITYGFGSGHQVFNVVYDNDKIIEFVSNSKKVVFTYNSSSQLTKKETFDLNNNQVVFKSEFVSNSNGQIMERKNWDSYNGNLIYAGKELTIITETN